MRQFAVVALLPTPEWRREGLDGIRYLPRLQRALGYYRSNTGGVVMPKMTPIHRLQRAVDNASMPALLRKELAGILYELQTADMLPGGLAAAATSHAAQRAATEARILAAAQGPNEDAPQDAAGFHAWLTAEEEWVITRYVTALNWLQGNLFQQYVDRETKEIRFSLAPNANETAQKLKGDSLFGAALAANAAGKL
jgi:hypothetical protein